MNFKLRGTGRLLGITSLILCLSACSSLPKASPHNPNEPNSAPFRDAIVNTGKSVPGAAKAPLQDLNLFRTDIPPILLQIEYPYRLDGPVYCDQLAAEITALNNVLGNSADVFDDEISSSEKAAQTASNAAQNALSDAATGWIPYRSLVRRVTGATKHEREIRNAYEHGRIRRAFLKGVGGAFQCLYPARPSSVIQPQKAENYRPR